ncbi:MAG: MerR family transcriptional regulator [Paracoccaceae bacterium]|nr:MAG: MerR family transcriptional regulator [Paracoccaceae bacterium]
MDKSPDAFRTISEVAEYLDTPAHVLRFWESRFPQVRPVKRAGGRRYYRPSDVALLAGIRRLLHDEGMTIRGVQKVLREQGVRHVAGLSADDAAAFDPVAADDVPRADMPVAEIWDGDADAAPGAEVRAGPDSWFAAAGGDEAPDAAAEVPAEPVLPARPDGDDVRAPAAPAQAPPQPDGAPDGSRGPLDGLPLFSGGFAQREAPAAPPPPDPAAASALPPMATRLRALRVGALAPRAEAVAPLRAALADLSERLADRSPRR